MDGEQTKRCREILSRFSTVMLLTHDDDKRHQGATKTFARPMTVAEMSEGCELWFLTDARSAQTAHITSDCQVEVVCQSPSAFLSLEGEADVVHDSAKVAKLWKEPFRTWFPKGKDDPNVVLLHVVPSSIEFWDESGINKLRYVFESAKAYVKGTRVDPDPNQHAKVRM